MKIKLIGYSEINVSADKTKTGKPFSGTNLYAVEKNDFVQGERYFGKYIKGACYPVCVPSSVAPLGFFKVGHTYDLTFNMAGYVDSVTEVNA